MLGFGALGEFALGEGPRIADQIGAAAEKVTITLSGIVIPDQRLLIPERRVAEGTLIRSTSAFWTAVVKELSSDWSHAYQLGWREWEEILAGAFKEPNTTKSLSLRRLGIADAT